ncbi:hypothetical protein IVU49_22350 [Salmonella enterica subsp. enterica serovar Worthington]|nr:hypothetical protein [Salmonella enterica subsp. enterica serovar Worthington]MBP1522655.1 hypothetical protein [Salmonella enterica subsp. enterica serovar Worthington]MBP1524230.1 hypothetical protein [Salmonella enterica subsp. enterica serovar Worthington]
MPVFSEERLLRRAVHLHDAQTRLNVIVAGSSATGSDIWLRPSVEQQLPVLQQAGVV